MYEHNAFAGYVKSWYLLQSDMNDDNAQVKLLLSKTRFTLTVNMDRSALLWTSILLSDEHTAIS